MDLLILGQNREGKIPRTGNGAAFHFQAFIQHLNSDPQKAELGMGQHFTFKRLPSISSGLRVCKHSKADHCCPVATQITEADTPRTAEGVKCHSLTVSRRKGYTSQGQVTGETGMAKEHTVEEERCGHDI